MSIITVNVPPVTPEQVRAEGSRRLNLLSGLYPPAERETWATQEREARAWLLDNRTLTPMLDGIMIPGEAKAALVASVIAKADALKAASAPIIGAQRALIAMTPIPQDYTDPRWWP